MLARPAFEDEAPSGPKAGAGHRLRCVPPADQQAEVDGIKGEFGPHGLAPGAQHPLLAPR
ncbi:hypothetical protein ABIE67_002396 [Streptomyces sp. V4I8]